MKTFEIRGLDEINRKLRRLDAAIGKKIVRRQMRKALKPVKDRVKQLAPVGATGNLKRAVKILTGRSRRKGSFAIRVVIGKAAFKSGKWYGAAVGLGTRKQDAQKFMQDAFAQTSAKAKADAEAGILAACLLELA